MSYTGKCPNCGYPYTDEDFACAECNEILNPVAIMEKAKEHSDAAQPTPRPRGSIDRATENTVVQCDGFNAPDCTRAVISEFLHQAKSVGLSVAPHVSAPTPSGEVDGLVAEIDALEKAYFDIPETEITENPQIYVLDPEIFQFLGKIADFLSAFDKALPKLRTALGGGWRDTESDSFESEPSICGYTPPQIEGET